MSPKLSKFERLDPDSREEWRRHHATDAFLSAIIGAREEIKEALALQIQSPTESLDNVRLVGGQLRALDYIIFLSSYEPAVAKEAKR